MIRDILVNLTQGRDKDPTALYAVSLAAEFGAHLTGVSIAYEIDVPPFYMGALPTDFIDAQVLQNRSLAEDAATHFVALAQEAGITHDVRTVPATLGIASDTFSRMARLYDLTIVPQPNPDTMGPESVMAESVLTDAGRAVLIVPYVQTKAFSAERAVLAWDGGRASARALTELLSLLHRAKHVQIFRIGGDEASRREDEELVRHLARHNLDAHVRRLPAADSLPVASAILNEVSDQGADILIMGGYGHSRLRQLVWGGVTSEILGSMTVPVFMAH